MLPQPSNPASPLQNSRSPKRKIAFAVALLLVASGIAFCWIVGSVLTAPRRAQVLLPALFNGSEITFASRSGATLHGNLLRGKNGHGVVILMHGVRGNRGAMSNHAEFLHRAGYSVLMFDFQAHGESTGEKITSGYLESVDAASAVELVREKFPGEKIAVLGSSLGGAAVILAEPPLQIDAAILELVYADIERAIKNRIAIVLGDWARPFSVLLSCQFKLRLGIDTDWFNAAEKIQRLSCPKLFLAGGKDRHTSPADTTLLFEKASPPKELWMIENAGHQNLHRLVKSEYEERILNFLAQHLPNSFINSTNYEGTAKPMQ